MYLVFKRTVETVKKLLAAVKQPIMSKMIKNNNRNNEKLIQSNSKRRKKGLKSQSILQVK